MTRCNSVTAAGDREEQGQGLVEYGLILLLISIVSIGIITTIGSQVVDLFTTVSNALIR
jgi:pilus assembly protein Flp/PilA